jgi:hypothetical protein
MFHRHAEVSLARFCALVCGAVFTWTCAVLGLHALLSRTCIGSFDCPAPLQRFAKRRVSAVEQAVTSYAIDRNRCPTTKQDLIDNGYINRMNFEDPWKNEITFACTDDDVRVASAGPDHIFHTADDVNNR